MQAAASLPKQVFKRTVERAVAQCSTAEYLCANVLRLWAGVRHRGIALGWFQLLRGCLTQWLVTDQMTDRLGAQDCWGRMGSDPQQPEEGSLYCLPGQPVVPAPV
jgi:hypothetical protein